MKKLIFFLLILLSFQTQNLFSQSWIQKLNGITIWSLATDMSGKVYAGSLGVNSKIYRSSNIGNSWDTIASGNGQTVFSMAFDSLGNMFVANYSAGLLKSTNGGLNFTIIPVSAFGNSNPQVVACGKKGHVYVGTNGGGFYRSIDTGNTFSVSGLTSLQVVSLLINKNNSAIIYAGVTSATAGLNGFYLSTDFGASFSANLNPNKNIFGIAQSNNGDLYTASTTTGGPVDKSTNGGINWSTIASGYIARSIVKGYYGLFVGGNGGVFNSLDDITFVNYGITSSVNALAYLSPNSNLLFAGVSGANGGVWIIALPTGINQINNEIPDNFSLSQNFPNPFNPNTNIKFTVPKAAHGVTLTVFDILGKEITTLVNEQLKPGTYSVEWNSFNNPSGIYFYKLAGGDYSETKKMVLIK